jgi:hypothetical protein
VAALALLSAVGNLTSEPNLAAAEDFRVDNAVYVGDQKTPSWQSVTIFRGGAVYDCMQNPDETVVFDKPAGRFILLNLKSQVRAELTTADVATAADRMQQVAAKKSDPLLQFLAAPKFQERFESAGGELTLDSPLVSYRLRLARPQSAAVVEQYRDFSDWYSRLNALTGPTSWPPQARMAVNAALADRKAIASQVILTVSSGKLPGGQQTVIRSEHRLVRPLTAADLDRVKQSREEMSAFKAVSFEQYRKLTPR